MNEENQLAKRNAGPLDIDVEQVSTGLAKIKAFQEVVRKQLVAGHDFGRIPGTAKPSLWKPGAEKLCKLLGLADSYQVTNSIEDFEKGFFHYQVTCELHSIQTGTLIAQGLGSCNSKESRYRYRWVFASEVPSHVDKKSLATKTIRTRQNRKVIMYRVDNDDIFSLVNTILKIGKKRAMLDAVLSAGRLSDIFSQDANGDSGYETQGLAERRQEALTYFGSLGVSQSQVLTLLGLKKADQITPEHLATLKDIATRVKAGTVSLDDIFGGSSTQVDDDTTAQPDNGQNDVTGDINAEKQHLLADIWAALNDKFPAEDDQPKRLEMLKHVFGKKEPEQIERLPIMILEAGLRQLRRIAQ